MTVDAALFSGSKCYFFDGDRYIRVTRGDTGPGTVDAGYPAPISNWNWPAGFAGAPGPTPSDSRPFAVFSESREKPDAPRQDFPGF
jgi:hypothetical protein